MKNDLLAFILAFLYVLGKPTEPGVWVGGGVSGCGWSCLRSGQGSSGCHDGNTGDREELGELHYGSRCWALELEKIVLKIGRCGLWIVRLECVDG